MSFSFNLKTKFFLSIIFFCFLFLFFSLPAQASDFSFDYKVTYNVKPTGITQVNQDITITNLTTQYYAQNFSLIISSERLENIVVFDNYGKISPTVTKENGKTTIQINFNEKVVGINKTNPFNISFDNRDVASKKGRIWEIIIPGIEKDPDINSYDVFLNVPKGFGKPAYFVPQPAKINHWNKNQLLEQGITAAYGDYQNFGFNLIYNLENTTNFSQLQEITLPPDTFYQKVILSRLSEVPENVVLDRDNNWLARFVIPAKTNKKIVAEGNVITYFKPLGEKTVDLSDDDIHLYTKPQPYWEQTQEINNLAGELKTAQKIYNWLIVNLDYNYDRVEKGVRRLGAKEAYQQKNQAVCMEYSDLFISLSRSAKIPSREIHGFAYTNNSRLQPLSLVSDVLHAWVEYYHKEKKQWVPVDPTWGDTTNGVDYFSKWDFNHVTLAILGKESGYPYPAGAFKDNSNSKNVFIDLVNADLEIPASQFEVEVIPPKLFFADAKQNVTLVIKNTGSVLLEPEILIEQNDDRIYLTNANVLTNISIPPFGKQSIPLQIYSKKIYWPKEHELIISVNDKIFRRKITLLPNLFTKEIFLLIILFHLGGGIALHLGRRSKNHE